MIKQSLSKFIFFGLLLVAAVAARAQSDPQDSSIAGLYSLLARIASHPAIASGKSNVDAARHRIVQTSSLDNPMLMFGVENLPTNSFGFSDDPMTSKMIGVSQKFPFPGKLQSEGEIAAVDTLTTQYDVDEERNSLARDAKLAYFEIYHVERIIAVYEFHLRAADDLIRLAESKLPTGNATQTQILNLQLERADIQNEVIQNSTMLSERSADLEEATADAGQPTITSSLGLPIFRYSIADLDSIARENRPSLRKLRAETEQEQLRYRREDLEKYPDFQVSLAYMQRDPLSASAPMNPMQGAMKQSNMISATVSFDLPFFDLIRKRANALGEAIALEMAKEAEARATELEIHTQLESQIAKLNGIQKEYALLRDDIYPTAEAMLETSNANYTYDKASIDDAIRAELNFLHREHDRYRLEAEYNKTIAEMEFLSGTTLVQYTSKSDWK